MTETIRVYARQLKNKKLEIDAAAFRIRAERRWGELYGSAEKAKPPGKPGKIGTPGGPISDVPTLDQMCISKKVSSRAQKLAAVPKAVFEEKLAIWWERVERENERVTVGLLGRT